MVNGVLFSAIGGTDPMANFKDGSMLHICRVYKPDVVYLYLSKEMCEFHDLDNRYLYCIKKLGQLLNHEFQVHLIERRDLIDVQKYDIFYKDFREIIKEIREKHNESMIYLNVSSGTPAMKSALQVMAIISEFALTPIQVSTPSKKINDHGEDRINYDVKTYWDLNEDNTYPFVKRCEESEGSNLFAEVMKGVVSKHMDAYDYAAALRVADTIMDHIPDDVFHLLKAMNWRLQLNVSGMTKELSGLDYDLLPEKNGEKRNIVEYILWMKTKVTNEEYSDFARGLTPIMTDLFIYAVKELCNINVKDYCSKSKNKYGNEVIRWDKKKLEKNPGLYKILNNEYPNFREDYLSTESMAVIIDNMCGDSRKNDIILLNEVENKIRNIAAHTIVSVTEDSIKRDTGFTPKQILVMLRNVAGIVNINISKKVWNSYDDANSTIKCLLE